MTLNTLFFISSVWLCLPVRAAEQPHPSSAAITGIVLDWTTHERRAPGSDNWPLTWADDGHQYTSWGDGGGFGGTNKRGRVSLGIARIEGNADSYRGFNVWGGNNSEHPATFKGKSYGILSVDGRLYMWVSPRSGKKGYEQTKLHMSTDHGTTWIKAAWKFTKSDGLINPTFLQFGRDHARTRDSFVYIYANRFKDESSPRLQVQKPGEIVLMRVAKTSIFDRTAYTFFNGLDIAGKPVWTSDLAACQPVFRDPNGVGWATGGVVYNAGLNRYLLTTEHTASRKGNLGVFDAPEPWGPWTTVEYIHGFGLPYIENSTFYWNFSSKWFSKDGKKFTLVFTGVGRNDAWNSVRGRFITN